MPMRDVRLYFTKSCDPEGTGLTPNPNLVVLYVCIKRQLGSGKQTYGDVRLGFSGKAASRSAHKFRRDQLFSSPSRTRGFGMQTVVAHRIRSSFGIAHRHPLEQASIKCSRAPVFAALLAILRLGTG